MDPAASDAMKIHLGEPSECIDEWARRYKRVGRLPVRSLRRVRRRGETALIGARQRTYRIAKRAFDCTFAALLLLVSSPLMCLIAIAIKLTDGAAAVVARCAVPSRRPVTFSLRTAVPSPPM